MLIAILPLVSMSHDALALAAVDMPTPSKMRTAQVQLADALASADAIHGVSGRDHTFTFAITRGDHRATLVATSDEAGDVIKVVERDVGGLVAPGWDTDEQDIGMDELGGLSWLADTMSETIAVTHLEVDEDGAVTLTTDQGMRYMAIPGRGSGGNAAAESRWAGDFDRDEG